MKITPDATEQSTTIGKTRETTLAFRPAPAGKKRAHGDEVSGLSGTESKRRRMETASLSFASADCDDGDIL